MGLSIQRHVLYTSLNTLESACSRQCWNARCGGARRKATLQVRTKPWPVIVAFQLRRTQICYLVHASSVNSRPPIRRMHRPKSTNEPTPTAGFQIVGAHMGFFGDLQPGARGKLRGYPRNSSNRDTMLRLVCAIVGIVDRTWCPKGGQRMLSQKESPGIVERNPIRVMMRWIVSVDPSPSSVAQSPWSRVCVFDRSRYSCRC